MSKNNKLTDVLNEAAALLARANAPKPSKTKVAAAAKVPAKPAAKVTAKASNPMTPKLNKIAKLIEKNVMTEADLVGAIGEVCRENKMSPKLAQALTEAMSSALDKLLAVEDDTIDL